MDWIKTVPKIAVREGQRNEVKIIKNGNSYALYVADQQWNILHAKSTFSLREFYSSYDLAQGNVLLSGFGFGVVAQWVASKPSVTSVTVIEKYQEVVDLFCINNTPDPKIKIVIDDIHAYKSNEQFDWAIFDHYELDVRPSKEELTQLESNLSYNNLWFWSLEYKLRDYTNWQEFRNNYSLKIPDLPKEQVLGYMETVFRKTDFLLQ